MWVEVRGYYLGIFLEEGSGITFEQRAETLKDPVHSGLLAAIDYPIHEVGTRVAHSSNSEESGAETNGDAVESTAKVCKAMGTSV